MGLPSENGGESCVCGDDAVVRITVSVSFTDNGSTLNILVEPFRGFQITGEVAFIFIITCLA